MACFIMGGMGVRHVLQPVVMADSKGVFGYEALARLAGGLTPDEHWYEAYRKHIQEPGKRHLAQLEIRSWRTAVTEAERRGLAGLSLFIKVVPLVVAEDQEALTILVGLRDRLTKRNVTLVPELVMTKQIGLDTLRQAAAVLRSAGFARLCLDNGVDGTTPLHPVMAAQPDFVRMDARLLEAMPITAVAIVQAIQQWGGRVIVVRVENDAQVAMVTEAGAVCGQGYVWGKPG